MPSRDTAWIHNLDDYRGMFDLGDADFKNRSVLNCPASISSFNAELHALGVSVVSADSHYFLQPLDMSAHVDKIIQAWSELLPECEDYFQRQAGETWDTLLNEWTQVAQHFLSDYSTGKMEKRYRAADFPALPFADFEFDLALCPDFLFQNSEADLKKALLELCRVADEVRIFPLLDAQEQIPQTMGSIMADLQKQNYGIEIRQVPYHRRKKGDAMLRLWARECVVHE